MNEPRSSPPNQLGAETALRAQAKLDRPSVSVCPCP